MLSNTVHISTFNATVQRWVPGWPSSYANAFMTRLEKTILDTAPDNKRPELYKRFLDDIFGVWLHGEAALLEFIAHANSAHPDITFTYKYGRSVDFLDTVVTLSGSTLVTDLFMKATDTHQYLLPSSNHPLHVAVQCWCTPPRHSVRSVPVTLF